MNQNFKSVEEIAADESFQEFCHGTSKRSVKKWQRKIKQDPSLSEKVEEARFLVEMFTPENQLHAKGKSTLTARNIAKVAAVFIFFVVAGFTIYSALQTEFPMIVKEATNSNIEVHLSDLTKVNLRKGSVITFRESWENSTEREVWLTGEAYFDVSKSKPFFVHLAKGSVKVLGTKFLVKSDSLTTQVILEEGRVTFLADSKEFEMSPGDKINYSSNEVSILSGSNINEYHSWMKSALAFKNQPLKDVINTINNSYEVEVILENERLEQRKITTTINQNDPHLLLTAITEIYGIKMMKRDGKIILK